MSFQILFHHWGIENNLQRTLDVVFREDLNRSSFLICEFYNGNTNQYDMSFLLTRNSEMMTTQESFIFFKESFYRIKLLSLT